jgi:hypothetical protein
VRSVGLEILEPMIRSRFDDCRRTGEGWQVGGLLARDKDVEVTIPLN